LSIITKLAEILNGSLRIESQEGVGSVFNVYLPLRIPLHDNVTVTSKVSDVADCIHPAKLPEIFPTEINYDCKDLSPSLPVEPKKSVMPTFEFPSGENVVLVVDDNDLNLKILSRMLDHFNLEYQTASNGKVAVEIMKKSRNLTGNIDAPNYSLILMDMQMPIMDGRKAIETMRKEGLTIPIIALTANALDHHREESLTAGASEFVTKPILRNDLYSKCCQYLGDPPAALPCIPFQ
jgi:two-component system chemotaxis sensor kinase CheA